MINRLVIILLVIVAGVVQAADPNNIVIITNKSRVSEQVIKIELEVPDVKVTVSPVKIEPVTSQVDVGTIITQVEGYYDNAYTKIDENMSRWVAIWGTIIAGVTIVVTVFGFIIPIINEKQRKTDFGNIQKDHENTRKLLGIQQAKLVNLEAALKAEISTTTDFTKEEVAKAIVDLENKTNESIAEISKETKLELYREMCRTYHHNELLHCNAGSYEHALLTLLTRIEYRIKSEVDEDDLIKYMKKAELGADTYIKKISSKSTLGYKSLGRIANGIISKMKVGVKETQYSANVIDMITEIENKITDLIEQFPTETADDQ